MIQYKCSSFFQNVCGWRSSSNEKLTNIDSIICVEQLSDDPQTIHPQTSGGAAFVGN